MYHITQQKQTIYDFSFSKDYSFTIIEPINFKNYHYNCNNVLQELSENS